MWKKTFDYNMIKANPYSNLIFSIPPEFHDHTFYEIVVVIKGKCNHTLNGVISVLSRGSVVFLRPKDVHCIDILSEDYRHQDIYIMPDKMERICSAISPGLYQKMNENILPFELTLTGETLIAIENKFNIFNTNHNVCNENLDILHSAVIGEIIGMWVIKTRLENKTYPDWLNNLLINLHNLNYLNLTVGEIINKTNYSHSYVCKTFQKYLNTTLVSYINKIKVDHSTTLLKQNMSIMQIASMLGWDNPKNYAIEFKKLYHISPSRYRAQLNSQ